MNSPLEFKASFMGISCKLDFFTKGPLLAILAVFSMFHHLLGTVYMYIHNTQCENYTFCSLFSFTLFVSARMAPAVMLLFFDVAGGARCARVDFRPTGSGLNRPAS